MNRQGMLRLLGVVLATAGVNVASAQVFECTNAGGVKEFAQFCPPGTVHQRQIGKSGVSMGGEAGAADPAGASGAAPKSTDAQDVEFRKRMFERQDAEAKAAQEKARAEEAEKNCLIARAQLQAVQDGQRMSRFDPATGERVQFGDDERAEETDRQRKAIEQWCK
jgi:hypothetical protein